MLPSVILRRLVARAERRERLAVGETRGVLSIVERHRPEDGSRDVGRQPQTIVAATRQGRVLAIGKGHQVIGALARRDRQHAGADRVVIGEEVDPGVVVLAIELLALAVEVPINVFRLVGSVVIHVRLGSAGPIKIVGAPLRIVHRRVPAVPGGPAVVAPLEERRNQLIPRRVSGFLERLLDRRVFVGGLQHPADPLVKRLLASPRRCSACRSSERN